MENFGYIYILLRADFIKNKQNIYKIGQTNRYPPHRRLWDYPYGSLFITLFKSINVIKLEKSFKEKLEKCGNLIWRKDIGVEYFEGDLQEIINILIDIYPQFQPSEIQLQKLNKPISENYLIELNRVHYIVNFDNDYFSHLYNHQFYSTNDSIKSEDIYDSYQKNRQWSPGYPDNYVIRCGLTPVKPLKPVYCYVPPPVIKKMPIKKISSAEDELNRLFKEFGLNNKK